MADEQDLALAAAALRADEGELAVSVEVLATSLEQALPQLAEVQRRRVGGFRSKRSEVQRITLMLGEETFELRRTEHALRCTRNKVVRGITLSRAELPLGGWVA